MPPGSPYRILAVDDVPSNLLTIRAILPETEFLFQGASNSLEAFELLKSCPFDLILLDVLLPGLDGYEIARMLKADPTTATIPVIFLTALKTEEEIVKGFEAGGVDFLSKPFHQSELLLRVRTHLTLRDKTEALQEANRARDQFFSILAHDLKNPFAGLLSLLEEILARPESLTPEELKVSLATMGQTAQNVFRLLETLLDWGRTQTGALTLDRQPQFLSFLVEEALDSLEPAFRKKEITLSLQVESFHVLADRYTVVVILRNLLSNALKFTKPGGAVTVTGELRQAGIAMTISDNGVGIAANRLPLLFKLENKVSTPGTSREPGTGLGLILCAEFAEKNQGSLEVQSRLGEGTRFTLVLPSASIARTELKRYLSPHDQDQTPVDR